MRQTLTWSEKPSEADECQMQHAGVFPESTEQNIYLQTSLDVSIFIYMSKLHLDNAQPLKNYLPSA